MQPTANRAAHSRTSRCCSLTRPRRRVLEMRAAAAARPGMKTRLGVTPHAVSGSTNISRQALIIDRSLPAKAFEEAKQAAEALIELASPGSRWAIVVSPGTGATPLVPSSPIDTDRARLVAVVQRYAHRRQLRRRCRLRPGPNRGCQRSQRYRPRQHLAGHGAGHHRAPGPGSKPASGPHGGQFDRPAAAGRQHAQARSMAASRSTPWPAPVVGGQAMHAMPSRPSRKRCVPNERRRARCSAC